MSMQINLQYYMLWIVHGKLRN